MSDYETIKQAKSAHQEMIFRKPNVVGVGIGYKVSGKKVTNELSLVVLVEQKVPLSALSEEALIPREVAGVRTDVVQVGILRPLLSRSERQRPAPPGVSLGHYKITAGTFGCVVRDRQSGARLILSNNHVLANKNEASPGDAILQPGPIDGGQMQSDVIARLERFIPIRYSQEPATCDWAKGFTSLVNLLARWLGSTHRVHPYAIHASASNKVDAAVARPLDDDDILDEILEIGAIAGSTPAHLGMGVRKSGRTTGLTSGEINVLDATVNVNYGFTQTVTFEDQIVTSPMSQGGDSGSLLVASDAPLAVGLLFAGSDQATIHNPIQTVLDLLNVNLATTVSVSSSSSPQSAAGKMQAVRTAYQKWLMSKANVVGVGVGTKKRQGKDTGIPALVVLVEKKMPRTHLAAEDIIPSEIDGVPVDVQEVGTLRPMEL